MYEEFDSWDFVVVGVSSGGLLWGWGGGDR